ncbi:MAG TPA: hypothetical protein DCZ94_18015 [Lentisphaeria bacterium]|nr:MAG: hypothetical protein A2X48_20610 [Lentisphaerae bacterium GWF2_49_21]HBC88843.1 hypothetical protein [Lentisphaeria bacterium]
MELTDTPKSICVKAAAQAALIVFAIIFFSFGLKIYSIGGGEVCRTCEVYGAPIASLMRNVGFILLLTPLTWSLLSMFADNISEQNIKLKKHLPLSGIMLIIIFTTLFLYSLIFFVRSISMHAHLGG